MLPVLWRLTPGGLDKAITAQTKLVIEGFPRSGNTFATYAIRHFAGPGLSIASHAHHIGQIKLAIRRGIPCVVVVRPPLETLASYLIAGPHCRPKDVFREYAIYYKQLLNLTHGISVVGFDQLTSDLPRVAERISRRWGTSLPIYDVSENDKAMIFEQIERVHGRNHPRAPFERGVARPSPDRNELNIEIRSLLLQEKYRKEMDRCQKVFEELYKVAETER